MEIRSGMRDSEKEVSAYVGTLNGREEWTRRYLSCAEIEGGSGGSDTMAVAATKTE